MDGALKIDMVKWNKIERLKKYVKYILIVMGSVIVLGVLFLIPFIIDKIYDCTPPYPFFEVELTKSDILDYYAQLLSLIATIILGVIAVVQTNQSQKKSDIINELQLRIAQRELEVIEKQYQEDAENAKMLIPRFEIKIDGYNGYYCNIKLQIKNISEMVVAAFQSISFEVEQANERILSITKWKIKFQSIASSEVQCLEMETPNFRTGPNSAGKVEFWKDVKLVWKFSCEDCKGNRYFYRATIDIPDTKDYQGDFWKIERIG